MSSLVNVETFLSFYRASSWATQFSRAFNTDVVVTRHADKWTALVSSEAAPSILSFMKDKKREEYYEECEAEDRMLAGEEAGAARSEIISEIWGDADQHQQSDETGWLYSDEDDDLAI